MPLNTIKPTDRLPLTDRLPPLAEAALSDAQRQAAARLINGPRGSLYGPFIAMLRSPEMLTRAQLLGEYLRFESALPTRLREWAIVITAAHWRQRFEWHVHAPLAVQAGVSAGVVAALPTSRPQDMPDDEAVIHDFCVQLLREHTVDDPTYARAHALLGERGVVDLCALCGYYSMLAMTMNVARTSLPPGVTTPFDEC